MNKSRINPLRTVQVYLDIVIYGFNSKRVSYVSLEKCDSYRLLKSSNENDGICR